MVVLSHPHLNSKGILPEKKLPSPANQPLVDIPISENFEAQPTPSLNSTCLKIMDVASL